MKEGEEAMGDGPRSSRREFLRTATAGTVALSLGGAGLAAAAAPEFSSAPNSAAIQTLMWWITWSVSLVVMNAPCELAFEFS